MTQPGGEEKAIFDELLQASAEQVQAGIPSAETARNVADQLTAQSLQLVGREVLLDCGMAIEVGDGEIVGEQMIQGRDPRDILKKGLRSIGVFKRFDVLDLQDTLLGSGRTIQVPEVCLVYERPDKSSSRYPAPEVTEIFVPITKIGEPIRAVKDKVISPGNRIK